MKKTFYSLLTASLFSIASLCAHGAEVTAQAIVLKVKGTANAISSGQSEPAIIKVGDKLPQGATVITGAGSEVDIQAFNGAVATIRESSTVNLEKLSVTTDGGVVTKQTALLSLKVGTVLSSIDPVNHSINDYSIRTPRGLATAHGTAFGVTVKTDGTVQLFVTNSAVTFINVSTGKSTTVPAGTAVAILPTGNLVATPFSALSSDDVKTLEKAYGQFKEVGSNTSSNTSGVPTFDSNAQQQSPSS